MTYHQRPQAPRKPAGLPNPYRQAKRPASARRGPALGLLLAGLLVLGGIAGGMDAEEADRQEEEYCANVHAGVWPDFDSNYATRCTKDGFPRPTVPRAP